MRLAFDTRFAKGSALGALALGFTLLAGPAPLSAAEAPGRVALGTATTEQAPVEMQRRGQGFRGGAVRGGARFAGPRGHYRGGGRGWRGPGGAAVGLGIAGAIIGGAAAAAAASQPRYYEGCWYERRWVDDGYGNLVRARVPVCP